MNRKHFMYYSRYLPVIIIALILTSSCKKDLYKGALETSGKLENMQLLNESRLWYNNAMTTFEEKDTVGNFLKKGSRFVGTPEWGKFRYYEYSGHSTFVRVPLTDYEVNCSFTQKMAKKGFRDLLLLKKSDKSFGTDIIEIHPDENYIQEKKKIKGNENKSLRELIDDKDFTGYFLVYTLFNDLKYGERRENGKEISTLDF